MNVSQLVQRVNACEHLGNVKARMSIVQNTGVVEQRTKVTSGNIFLAVFSSQSCRCSVVTYHGKINALVVLESIEQAYKPLALSSGQDITLRQDMADLIQLEQ